MRRARQDLSTLPRWLTTYGIELHGIAIQATPFGSGTVAVKDLDKTDDPLIYVPKGLILSQRYVWEQAQRDPQLKEVLKALGKFGTTDRGAILTFLLLQIAATSPDMQTRIGIDTPWTTYIQYLPTETGLPTMWSDTERNYADGTTLEAAIRTKLASLERCLSVQDWKVVDAIWRSRALELPHHGLCMVPVADMANHTQQPHVTGRIDVEDDNHNVRLIMDTHSMIPVGKEVTITYGEEKGACEMIFSYGFIDQSMVRAESLFLNLEDPEDDPLFEAKKHAFECPPGFRLMHQLSSPTVRWIGPFVWLMCINEEDGLELTGIEVDGKRAIQAFWHGKELKSILDLVDALEQDFSYDLFRLRAYTIVSGRVREEVERREASFHLRKNTSWWDSRDESSRNWRLSERLRSLEQAMLHQACDDFDQNVRWLYNTPAVQRFFNPERSDDEEGIETKYMSDGQTSDLDN